LAQPPHPQAKPVVLFTDRPTPPKKVHFC